MVESRSGKLYGSVRFLSLELMFTSLNIHRYRSCMDVALDDLPHVTALVGRNGAGKTSVLRAVRWLAAVGCGQFKPGPSHAFDERDVSASIRLAGVTFSLRVTVKLGQLEDGTHDVQLKEQISWVHDNGQPGGKIDRDGEMLSSTFHSEPLSIGKGSFAVPLILALFPSQPARDELMKLVQFLVGVRYYGLDEVQYAKHQDLTIVLRETYARWQQGEVSLDESDVPLKIVHLSHENPESFVELKEYLGPNGLDLISDISIREVEQDAPAPTFFLVYFRVASNEGGWRSFGQLSAGTRRVLNLLTAIVHDDCTVMLLEHPEDSVHDALLAKLVGLIKSNADPRQVLFTSHSTTALNLVDLHEVRLVSIADGHSSVRSLSTEERDAACRFVSEDGAFADFLESVQDQ